MSTDCTAYIWNDSENVFEEKVKVSFELGTQGEVLIKETLVDNGAGGWKKARKNEIEYNTNGKVVLFEASISPLGVNWENDLKYEIDYNSNGDINRTVKYQGLVNHQWQPQSKDTLVYSGSSLIQKWSKKWDIPLAEWNDKAIDSLIYSYNSVGLCDTVTIYSILYVDGNVELSKTETYQYNIHGNPTQAIFKTTNNQAHTLKPYYRIDYVYNYTYPTWAVTYSWNDSNSNYERNQKWLFSYEGNLFKRIDAEIWDTGSNDWLPSTDNWFGRRTTFYYEDIDAINSINKETFDFEFNIYPNPSSDKIHVEVADGNIQNIHIVNLEGRTVYKNQKTLNAQSLTIPVGQLAPGVYFLKVNNGVAEGVKRFVVK